MFSNGTSYGTSNATGGSCANDLGGNSAHDLGGTPTPSWFAPVMVWHPRPGK